MNSSSLATRVPALRAAFAASANDPYATQLLDNRNLAHLDRAAQLIARGQIVAFGFNGVLAFIGDAAQPEAAIRMAQAKGQPLDKTLALVCPPERLAEFVATEASVVKHHGMERLLDLQMSLHGLGLILPADTAALPSYATENDTVLNVWFEYAPARYLYQLLRQRGVKTLIGTSANQHGESTYVDPMHALRVFGGRVPAIVAHDASAVPEQRRQSSTLVDFTGRRPRVVRHGSVTIPELRTQLRRLGLADLCDDGPLRSRPAEVALH